VRLSRSTESAKWLEGGGGLVILICLSVLTWRQSATYHDLETLWRTTIARNPSCWMAYGNLGVVQFQKGNIEDAVDKYEAALRLHDAYSEGHYNLASALLQQGKIDEAIMHGQRAIELEPSDPDAHVVLGNAFMNKQDFERAIREYDQALTIRPEDSNAHYNLGAAFRARGENDRADLEYEKARQFEQHGPP